MAHELGEPPSGTLVEGILEATGVTFGVTGPFSSTWQTALAVTDLDCCHFPQALAPGSGWGTQAKTAGHRVYAHPAAAAPTLVSLSLHFWMLGAAPESGGTLGQGYPLSVGLDCQ